MGFGNEVPGPSCFPLNRAARTAAQAPTASDCKKLFKENVAADYPENLSRVWLPEGESAQDPARRKPLL